MTLNGSLINLYLPNFHGNVTKYEDFLLSFRLWYPKPTSVMVIYHTFVSLGSISFHVDPLCTTCTGTCLSLVESRHICTVLLDWGNITKLLHISAVLSTPSGASILCCCWLSSSFIIGSCSTYHTHLWSTWYGFVQSLTCRKKIPLKYTIPVNRTLYSSCVFSVVLPLAFLCLFLQWSSLFPF